MAPSGIRRAVGRSRGTRNYLGEWFLTASRMAMRQMSYSK
jgi:hypothetical protein